jgi:hypothetical protein
LLRERCLLNKRWKFTIGGVSLLLISGGFAAAAPSKPTTIYACISSQGAVAKVSTKVTKCAKGTTLLTWNQTGVAGATGLKGEQGVQGAKGDSAESAEVEITYRQNGVQSKGTTSQNGKFLNVDGALWPVTWGSGSYLPELGGFRTSFRKAAIEDTLSFPSLNCAGDAHAFIGIRNNVDIYKPENIVSKEWTDNLPPVPLENEVRVIRDDFLKVSENTFNREETKSYRDSNGFCKNGKPFSDLYKLQVYEDVEVGSDENGAIYEYMLVYETPLFFVKVSSISEAPTIEGTTGLLQLRSR